MKLRVHVVMGGPSAEYEISLISGHQVLLHLDTNKYDVRAVIITKERRYYCRDLQSGAVPSLDALRAPGELAPPYASSDFAGPFSASDSAHIWNNCDVAFLALHGEFGEDGRFQGFLENSGDSLYRFGCSGICFGHA